VTATLPDMRERRPPQTAGAPQTTSPTATIPADGYVVPPVLRKARFVPRHQPGRREPLRVTRGAFTAAGLPVPDDPRQHNSYQLSQRQGWPWSPALDEHTRRRGAELLGGSEFVCIDCDVTLAVDRSVWLDGMKWLVNAGTERGELLDLTTFVAVRTPGNPSRGHGPGWHLWARADPETPVRFGVLARCKVVELKPRCTAPGSPGYEVRHAPRELPTLPRWIAELAGPPRVFSAPRRTGGSPAAVWRRLHGIVGRVLAERDQGERNSVLYWAACRTGELVASGALDGATAERVLCQAAAEIGLTHDDGEAAVRATIRSGFSHGTVGAA
jgi:hypothetical protein